MYYYLYKIVLTEGRLKDHYYIGRHKTENLDDGYKGSGTILKRYYKKHPTSFTKYYLQFFNNDADLSKAEEELVKQHLGNELCLNLCNGGRTNAGFKHTDDYKNYMREINTGERNPSYGKRWMTNGEETIYIKRDKTQKYLNNGYKFGRK